MQNPHQNQTNRVRGSASSDICHFESIDRPSLALLTLPIIGPHDRANYPSALVCIIPFLSHTRTYEPRICINYVLASKGTPKMTAGLDCTIGSGPLPSDREGTMWRVSSQIAWVTLGTSDPAKSASKIEPQIVISCVIYFSFCYTLEQPVQHCAFCSIRTAHLARCSPGETIDDFALHRFWRSVVLILRRSIKDRIEGWAGSLSVFQISYGRRFSGLRSLWIFHQIVFKIQTWPIRIEFKSTFSFECSYEFSFDVVQHLNVLSEKLQLSIHKF